MSSKWLLESSTSLSLNPQTDGVRSTIPIYYPQIVTVDNKLLLVNAAVRSNTGSTTSDGWEDLVFTFFDKTSLSKVGSSNFVVQPYHQAPQGLIKTAPNQAFLLYASQPSGYHGDGFGLLVDSSGARSSAFSAIDQWSGADWAYGLGRLGDGTYVVTWSSERNGLYDVFAQNLSASGVRIGNPYLVLGGSGAQFTADETVAVIPNSNQYVTAITNFGGGQYGESPSNIQLLFVDKSTSSLIDQQILSSTPGDLAKTLIYTSAGAGAVIFESGTSIYARAFSVNSSKLSLGNSILLWNKSSAFYNVDISVVETNGGLVAVGIASSNGIDRKLTQLEFDPKSLTITSDPITIASTNNAVYMDAKLTNVDLFFDSGVLFAAWTDVQNGEIDVFKLGQTPSVQFSSTLGSFSEGNSGTSVVTIQATLSAASTQAVTVPVTYSGTATSGTDYTNATTSITIAAGQTTGSASFSVVGDTTRESDETVILTMGTPTNATLGVNKSYTHTIVNDDQQDDPARFEVNGHWYDVVVANVSWEGALKQAATNSYRGLGGYLATVTNSQECYFIFRFLPDFYGDGYFLAGIDKQNNGVWTWAAGPEVDTVFSYTNWSIGQPSGNQGYLQLWNPTLSQKGSGEWDDVGATGYAVKGYIVEFGGLPATYTITLSATSVNEGSSVTFTINTKNVEWGTKIEYAVIGVDPGDVDGRAISGEVLVEPYGNEGRATVTIKTIADNKTDGDKNLVLNIAGQSSAPVVIKDSSVSKEYVLNPSNGHFYFYPEVGVSRL